MEQSRRIENREWNGPEQWEKWKWEWNGLQQKKICKSGMERSRTMENIGIGNGTVPNNEKMDIGNGRILNNEKWDMGMGRSRTMEKMGYGNGTVPNNGKYGNREWNSPEQ